MNGQDDSKLPVCSIAAEFLKHREEAKKSMAVISSVGPAIAQVGENTKHLPTMVRQNTTITFELKQLRTELVAQLEKLIDAQAGRVPEGFIPLETYKEHIDSYKETYRFFMKLIALIIVSLFGLAKVVPEIFQIIFPH